MRAIKHLLQQPFIASTSLASLCHSTWVLATLFGGNAPSGEPSPLLVLQWAYWLIPALLIAFSLDIGQMATSYELRNSEGLTQYAKTTKYFTFAVFSIANYLLQWLYLAHHLPQLELAGGVRSEWLPLATLLRDFSLWFLPLLLPLSALLYTLSGNSSENRANPQINLNLAPNTTYEQPIARSEQALALLPTALTPELPSGNSEGFMVNCECGEFSKAYTSQLSANRGLAAHKQHCTLARIEVSHHE